MLQYIPSKAAKFGVKFWVLAESTTGYVAHLKCYLGKKFTPTSNLLQGTEVVLRLLKNCNLLQKGYHVVSDSFFCSFDLARKLIDLNTYLTGTLRSNRKMPLTIRNAHVGPGESVYVRQGEILAAAYKGRESKKPVRMISTFINAANSNGKPKIIQHYNMNMGGVDGADMMLHFYNDNRKSTKVWKKLAINIIHRMCSNAYILYRKNTSDAPVKSRLRFIQEVIEALSSEYLVGRDQPVRGVRQTRRDVTIQHIQG